MTTKTTTRPTPVHPQEVQAIVAAADLLLDALAVQVSAAALLETLDAAERRRLLTLTRKLRERPEVPGAPAAGPDERYRAQAFADALERTPTASTPLKHELKLLAAYVRRIDRMPSSAERVVFRGIGPDATLETLARELQAAAGESTPRTGGVWWASLDDGEQRELESLVERVVGLGFFAKRRGQEAARLSIEVLAAWAERPSPLRLLAPPGAAVLPAAVLDDLAAGRLHGLDAAVLAVVALTFAGRRIDPRVEQDVAWTDDGATLIVRAGLHRLLPTWGEPVAPGTDAVTYERQTITRRLVESGWLDVETAERDLLRVRLGARFRAK
jgi:hypothetical protein